MSPKRRERLCREARLECDPSPSYRTVSYQSTCRTRESQFWHIPSHAESDVGQTDASVNEEDSKTRERQKPAENVAAVVSKVDECQATKEELHEDDIDGTALLVDLGEEFGRHACDSKSALYFG